MTMGKKPLENIVGKGKKAGNQHFLLFPQCFLAFPKGISISQSHLLCRLQMLLDWTDLKFCHLVELTLSKTSPCLQYKSFKNTVGKEEIARNDQFLLFPECFLRFWRIFCHFHEI